MKRNFLHLVILIGWILSAFLINTRAQNPPENSLPPKEIAVTIDDLLLNGPRIELKRLQVMTGKILSGIKRHQIPVVGFVNESLLYIPDETDARIALLKSWSDAGVELGNHTFSHLGFEAAALAEYEDDFIRGETITKMLMKQKGQKIRYFRHPFLQMGNTPEIEKSFENFIAARGYRIAPVTIDTMDWMFLAAYSNARRQDDAVMMKRVSEEYLKFVALRFDFAEKVAAELFGRPIKHILLLHANELNADNFDALIKVIKDKGYSFITLEAALKDAVYRFPDKYRPTSDWLSHWVFSKEKKIAPPPMPPDFIQKAFNEASGIKTQ
ncbi:MAG TPA: polysaccharide deacetylase family protein [Pyrinomonadaceae bacterium]|jgi:peptidoglycan/xylan/chitin deacetylase (PgdA/CDA1 family)